MPKITIAELQLRLAQANRIIESQQEQISEINRQYADVVSKKEYDCLIEEYEALEHKYKALEYLFIKKKVHNERGAGRKTRLSPEIISDAQKLKNEGLSMKEISGRLDISVGSVHKAVHSKT